MKNEIAKEVLSDIMGSAVGKVNVNQPIKHTHTYECPAWWSQVKSKTGVFDLVLAEQYNYPCDIVLKAVIPATTQEDYFQSFVCGNSIGEAYDRSRNTGKLGEPVIAIYDICEAISATGNTPSDTLSLFVEPKYWDLFLKYYHRKLDANVAILDRHVKTYHCGNHEYRQLGYACGIVREYTRIVRQIKLNIKRMSEHTTYQVENFKKNTEWARES